ncbi:MAG TPA: tagaturonate reductase [Chryseolinea sp.]|nr:tagaturonate reductase [Chryseolinea sp.]
MLKKLNQTTTPNVIRPVKILQFGEGNFLRAFVDWIVDILNEKTDFNGAIEIIQPINRGMTDMVNKQDGLYHVVLKGVQQGKVFSETRLVTCVSKAINPYEDFESFLTTAENPDLKFIVSNTTEAGIAFHASDSSPATLDESFPGKLTQLLFHRFKFFNGNKERGLIFLPCELIESNGNTLKETILRYAGLWKLPEDFKHWITSYNQFCNTLVDRIVPGFPKETIHEIQQSIGYEDNLVVQAEPFHLWVIEGPESLQQQFPATEAGLQVKFVKDLTPYRTRKVRILNGAHTTLVPVAYLTGIRTVKDSIDDQNIGTYIRNVIFNEIIPTLDLPADELTQFANDVIERFQNPFIKHELLSIALNSISKFKVRVLPSVLEFKKRTGKLPVGLLYSLAALIRFYKGEWQGDTIPLNDSPEVLDFFKMAWQEQDVEKVVQKVLSNESFWGQDLTQVDGLANQVTKSLKQIEKPD